MQAYPSFNALPNGNYIATMGMFPSVLVCIYSCASTAAPAASRLQVAARTCIRIALTTMPRAQRRALRVAEFCRRLCGDSTLWMQPRKTVSFAGSELVCGKLSGSPESSPSGVESPYTTLRLTHTRRRLARISGPIIYRGSKPQRKLYQRTILVRILCAARTLSDS